MAAKKPVVLPPEEQVPTVDATSSSFRFDLKNTYLIDYSHYPMCFKDDMKSHDFSNLPPFEGNEILASLRNIAKAFDETENDQLYSATPEIITNFVIYLKDIMPPQINGPLNQFWPPLLPEVNDEITSAIFVIAKLIRYTTEPMKVLRYISFLLFPQTWTPSSSETNKEILAVSECTLPGKKDQKWAILLTNGNFVLQTWKKDKFIDEKKGTWTEIVLNQKKKSIQVKSNPKKVIAEFVPKDPNHTQLWIDIGAKKKHPIISFFTSLNLPVPDVVYTALNSAILHSDNAMLISFLSLPPEEQVSKTMIAPLFNIYSYAQKLNVFYNTVVADHFEKKYKADKPSHLRNLFDFLVKKFAEPYSNEFLTKLVAFIDERASSNPSIQTVVIAVLKYIILSGPIIPIQFRHLFNVIHRYVAIRKNNLKQLYQTVSCLFFDVYVSRYILNTERLLKTKVQNIDFIKEVVSSLQVPLHLGLFMNDDKNINKRLEKHTLPALADFIFSISILEGDAPDYEPGEPKDLARALDSIFKGLTAANKTLLPAYTAARSCSWSVLSYNFSALISTFFVSQFDIDRLDSIGINDDSSPPKKKKTKLVPVELRPDANGVLHRLVPISYFDEVPKDRHLYKRVVKKVPRETVHVSKVVRPVGAEDGEGKVLKKLKGEKGEYVIKIPREGAPAAKHSTQMVAVSVN